MTEQPSDARYDSLRDGDALELGDMDTPTGRATSSRNVASSRGEIPILAFWTFASSVSLVTSKYLLVDRVYRKC
jgi:hypothetical protein